MAADGSGDADADTGADRELRNGISRQGSIREWYSATAGTGNDYDDEGRGKLVPVVDFAVVTDRGGMPVGAGGRRRFVLDTIKSREGQKL